MVEQLQLTVVDREFHALPYVYSLTVSCYSYS
jgi:hypothetical protein